MEGGALSEVSGRHVLLPLPPMGRWQRQRQCEGAVKRTEMVKRRQAERRERQQCEQRDRQPDRGRTVQKCSAAEQEVSIHRVSGRGICGPVREW